MTDRATTKRKRGLARIKHKPQVAAPDKKPPLCSGCGVYYADPPGDLCPGCDAYREHQQ